MPTAGAVATKLRELADSLDKNPEAEIPKPHVLFNSYIREPFLAIARLLPRPLIKSINSSYSQPEYRLVHDTEDAYIWAMAPQSVTCKLVTPAIPAVYDCDPILSPEEDAQLEVL